MAVPGQPTLVSLFAGAGGLDIGLERAGFHTVSASDHADYCVQTLAANQAAGIEILGQPGRRHLAGARIVERGVEVLDAADLRPPGARASWRPDLLAGGPPCQPFSSAGSQRSVNDPRGRLFEHFVRLADELRPKVVLFENVRGLVTARGPHGTPGEALSFVRHAFEEVGYATSFRVLSAADFGASQRRVRLFMLAAAPDAALPDFPLATHAKDGGLLGAAEPSEAEAVQPCLKPWVSLREYLAGRPAPAESEIVRPTAAVAALLAELPDGSGLKSMGRAEPTRPGGHWGYKQGTFIADQSLPARTVTGATTQDWVRRDGVLRRMTLAEIAGLQGFPAEWVFAGPRAKQFLQVGNAVPATFGEVLGASIVATLQRKPRRRPASEPFPDNLVASIDYATRDDLRNGAVRPRSPRFVASS